MMERPVVIFLVVSLNAVVANHYDTLGVTQDASTAAIKAAFRKGALRHHPDKSRDRGAVGKAAAAERMERLNDAYATLLDPASRRDYDQSLRNPFHRTYGPAPQHREYAPPQVVKMTVDCSLEQLGGFAPVEIPLSEVPNVPPAAARHFPPLRVFLPAGCASGDLHRVPLPHLDAVLVLKLMYTKPHPVFARHGNDLIMTVYVAAWHNRVWWQRAVGLLSRTPLLRTHLSVRSLSGGLQQVCSGDIPIPATTGRQYKIRGMGMPIRAAAASAGGSPYGVARGNLHVYVKLRDLKTSARNYAGALAAAACVGLTLPKFLRLLLPSRGRKKVLVLSRWTGPGPGISAPFRIWGKPGLFKYRLEYVD